MSSLAVLIDADNMPAEHAPEVMRRARLWGDVSIVRLFGDFSGNRLADWRELAHNNGYETVLQLNGGKGKNSTDIALTIHAMDLLHDGAVDCFCLASNDRDFLPLAARLRGAGKRVYAVCTKLDQRMTMSFTATIALAPRPRLAVQTAGPSPSLCRHRPRPRYPHNHRSSARSLRSVAIRPSSHCPRQDCSCGAMRRLSSRESARMAASARCSKRAVSSRNLEAVPRFASD